MSILVPLVSEKAFSGAERGTYMFKVSALATKHAVKREVESQFAVTVTDVRIAKVPGKTRRRGRHAGFRPGYKKAIVQLKAGDRIKELAAG